MGEIPAKAGAPRFFPGQRWVHVGLRALHLLGVVGVGAGVMVPGAPAGAWHPYLLLTLVTGVGMILLDLWSDLGWVRQVGGLTVLVKLCLLGLIPLWPEAATGLFVGVLLLSAVVAHAPGRVRHRAVFGQPSRGRHGAPSA